MKSGASEADIWQTIDMFKERYSDYGSDRRSAIEFHTNQLEKLLLPTKLTKLCMWMLLRMDKGGGEEALPMPSTPAGMPTTTDGAGEGGEGGGGGGGGGDGTATRRLWATLAAELGVTEAQQAALLAQRGTVQGMDTDLQVRSVVCVVSLCVGMYVCVCGVCVCFFFLG